MIRMLIVGYCLGIRSERRLCDEVRLNLAGMTMTVVENTDDNVHLVLPGPCHGAQGGVGGYMSDLVEGWVVKE